MTAFATAWVWKFAAIILVAHRKHLEQQTWPYAATQKEVERKHVALSYHREHRENGSVRRDGAIESARLA